MEIEKVKESAVKILQEVLKRLHSREYVRVLEVVDEIEIGMDNLSIAMECVRMMIDPEDDIDELSDDELSNDEIHFYETTKDLEYTIEYELRSCGDGLEVMLFLDFYVSEIGIRSVLRTIDI